MDKKEVLVPGFDLGVRLETRRGNQIPTVRCVPKIPIVTAAGEKIHRKKFPNIETRSLDSTYNCVGMVFAFRRAWVNNEYVPQLLEDDEYHEVPRDKTVPGDLIVYYAKPDRKVVEHVGIIVDKKRNIEAGQWGIRVLSKWGSDGEYLHCEKDVPAQYGSNRVYYSERKCNLLSGRK